MTTLEVNGSALAVMDQGSGDPVVLVHGSASDYRTWDRVVDDLVGQYRTITYSRRYHWPNEPIPDDADYAMEEQVDDLLALLHELDAGPVHLVGHSYGAFVAMLVAIREPQLVRSLVLAEPPAVTLFVSSTPQSSELLHLLLHRPRTALAIARFGAKGMAPAADAARHGDMDEAMSLFGTAVLGEEFYNSLSGPRMQQVKANSIRAEFVGSGFPPLDDDDIRGIEAPTLLVSGQLSPAIFDRITDRLEELLPQVTRVDIPGASHIMHEDNPAAHNAALRTFLAAQSAT